MRKIRIVQLALIAFGLLIWTHDPASAQTTIPNELSQATKACLECHAASSHGIYQEWGTSKHYRANVGCYECHQAQTGDKDAFKHDDYLISIIVSPKDCARCHAREVAQFEESHHAKAGLILGSLDNFLADIVEGDRAFYGESALTVSGCKQCHGGEVKINPDGSLSPTGWPNTGMGRLNPDGSIGACTACHQRHAFSAEQARRPEACGKCHLGPDHPQKEIYEESKHGIAYEAHRDDLNMDDAKWVLGEDYTAAPTCATCHMSAVRTSDGSFLPITHDVGTRISLNNRPELSIRPEVSDQKLGLTKMASVTWDKRRAEMQKVCTVCHTPGYVGNFYEQYDGVVNLYNRKFAEPGVNFMTVLRKHKLITDMPFDETVEWTWWEIWHHEGRRARHGVSMFAPDYTHWHGLYEVGKHFYTKFIPELRAIVKENLRVKDKAKIAGAKVLDAALRALLAKPEHSWYTGNLPAEENARRKREQEEFKKRYIK
ncbi:MAG TPA: hydroxylamine oxidoreductase [Candidatus Aminicenantes bacterium]|nr:hydroxylamine oxidoreductase [Candidatus Aminicenantes bacterium]